MCGNTSVKAALFPTIYPRSGRLRKNISDPQRLEGLHTLDFQLRTHSRPVVQNGEQLRVFIDIRDGYTVTRDSVANDHQEGQE